jgi:secreted Zn-dependent insulinase-like peptidase
LTRIRDFRTLAKEDMAAIFSQVKEKLMQDWYNFYFDQSYRQAGATFETVVLAPGFEKRQLRASLEPFTFEDFYALVGGKDHWLVSGRCIWFLLGNISKETALAIAEKGRNALYGGRTEGIAVPKEALPDVRSVALPNGAWYRLEKPLEDKENENSCLISYFEAG